MIFVQQRHVIHTNLFPLIDSHVNHKVPPSTMPQIASTSNTSVGNNKSSFRTTTSSSQLSTANSRLSENHDIDKRPVSKPRLVKEFERFGNIVSSVKTGNLTYSSSCVLVAATGTGYRYSAAWISNRRSEGVPFVLFEVEKMRMGELSSHYARIPALLATSKTIPRARYLVYTDVDTLVNFDVICAGARNHPRKSLSISYKVERSRRIIRTNFFVFHPCHRRAEHLMLTWLYAGRDVSFQDQTVLNELYNQKKWIRDSVQLVKVGKDLGRAEIRHCGSYRPDRNKCMMTLRMDLYKSKKKQIVAKS